jgi:hypothetical protein
MADVVHHFDMVRFSTNEMERLRSLLERIHLADQSEDPKCTSVSYDFSIIAFSCTWIEGDFLCGV